MHWTRDGSDVSILKGLYLVLFPGHTIEGQHDNRYSSGELCAMSPNITGSC